MVALNTSPGASSPRVSIGLPVYNGDEFLAQSIASVLSQTFTDFELIISDNASADRTVEIAESFAADDPRVRVIRNSENRGAAWNYNHVFDEATAPLFRWHAHDDYFEPALLERLVAALDAAPDAVLAHSWTRFIDDDGATLRDYEDDLGASSDRAHERLGSVVRRLTYCNAVFGVIRRDQLAKTARIGSFPGSDVSLLYELAVRGPFVVVPELLYVRRPGASIKANPTSRQVAQWFGPSGKGRRFPGLHLATATLSGVWRAPLSFVERVRSTLTFVRWWPLDYARKVRRRRRRHQR